RSGSRAVRRAGPPRGRLPARGDASPWREPISLVRSVPRGPSQRRPSVRLDAARMVRLGQEMVRVVVTGIAGRMGRAIAEAIDAMDGIRFVAGTIRRGGNAAGLSDRLAMPVDDSLEAALDRGADAVI